MRNLEPCTLMSRPSQAVLERDELGRFTSSRSTTGLFGERARSPSSMVASNSVNDSGASVQRSMDLSQPDLPTRDESLRGQDAAEPRKTISPARLQALMRARGQHQQESVQPTPLPGCGNAAAYEPYGASPDGDLGGARCSPVSTPPDAAAGYAAVKATLDAVLHQIQSSEHIRR